MKMENWIGKVAVITGASAGIGAAITRALAAKGMIVIGLARRVERIEDIAKEFHGKTFAHKCDVSNLNSIKETFEWIEENFGAISVLINNAGTLSLTNVLDDSSEAIESVISTNFTGLVHCTREAIKMIRKSKDYGMIINVSSVADSSIPFCFTPNIYPSTKHAVRAFSELLRQDLIKNGDEKIRICNLSPGVVKTDILKTAMGIEEEPEQYSESPFLSVDDIVESMIYLLSTPKNVNVTQLTIKPVGEKF